MGDRTDLVHGAFFGVSESIADLTIEEADIVLEALRIAYRIKVGPTTDGDARRLVKRLEERDL